MRQALYQAIDSGRPAQPHHAQPVGARRRDGGAHGAWLEQTAGRARRQVMTSRPPRSCWPTPAIPRALPQARLPERPLRERRGHLPGRHSDVDAHRRQDQSADRADGAVCLARDEQRRQRLPVRLGVATFDALYTLDSLMSTKDGKTAGRRLHNGGRFSDPKARRHDPADQGGNGHLPKRDALIHDALKLTRRVLLPALHHQIRPWAMQKNVDTVHRADDRPMPTWTTIMSKTIAACARFYQHFRQKCHELLVLQRRQLFFNRSSHPCSPATRIR